MLVLTRFAVSTDLSATQTASTASTNLSATAIEEFIAKYEVIRQQRRQGKLSAEDWDAKYTDFIESEAEELKGMLPNILGEIGERLRYRSDDQERFDALADLKHPNDDQSKELLSLTQKIARDKEIPRCTLTFLTAYLGRTAPKEAVDVLLTSDPPPEEADDWCYIKSLMTIGPTGYQPIPRRSPASAN
jgi:hypothetical protein